MKFEYYSKDFHSGKRYTQQPFSGAMRQDKLFKQEYLKEHVWYSEDTKQLYLIFNQTHSLT
jgi:hypothetical protein